MVGGKAVGQMSGNGGQGVAAKVEVIDSVEDGDEGSSVDGSSVVMEGGVNGRVVCDTCVDGSVDWVVVKDG